MLREVVPRGSVSAQPAEEAQTALSADNEVKVPDVPVTEVWLGRSVDEVYHVVSSVENEFPQRRQSALAGFVVTDMGERV